MTTYSRVRRNMAGVWLGNRCAVFGDLEEGLRCGATRESRLPGVRGVDPKNRCANCRHDWSDKQLKNVGLIFHDLRRSGVRNLIRVGVQQKVAMEISGHKTASVFQRYNIVDQADIREAGRKLNEKQKSNALLEISFGQSTGMIATKTVRSDHLQPLPPHATMPN